MPKYVSKRPAVETAAKAEVTANPDNLELDAVDGNAIVKGPGGDITKVDIKAVSKADVWNGQYEIEP